MKSIKIQSIKDKSFLNSLSFKKKLIITIISLIIILLLTAVIVRLYFLYTKINFKFHGTFKEALLEEPKSINPLTAQNDTDKSITQLIYSGLLKKNKNLEFKPDLLDKLPQKPKDQNYYKACLKKEIFWHDDKPLSVDDIVYTFNKAKKFDTLNPKLSLVELIDITKLDNRCLKIETDLNKDQLYPILTTKIIPKHIWSNFDLLDNNIEFSLKPVGTGMFQFDSLGKDEKGNLVFYKLKANTKFYNKKPYIKNIKFLFYGKIENAYNDLLGQKISAFSPHVNIINENLENIRTFKFKWNFYNALFFNLDKELFKEKSLRQALSYLTPKHKILKENLNYNANPIFGPILPFSTFYNNSISKNEFNKDKAINILKRNDWRKNNNGFWEKDDEIIEFSIKTINQPIMVELAKNIQEAWQEIGLKVKLIILPTKRIKPIITNKDFDIILYGVLTNYNTGLFSLWHSSNSEISTLNITNLDNRKIDELLENALIASDIEKKRQYYKSFQTQISQLKPAIFLYNFNYNYLVDKNIQGIGVKAIKNPGDRFINIENWYNLTQRTLK